MGGTSGKSFLSDIEKGKRSISGPTAGRLIKALNLDESWIDKFVASDTPQGSEQTKDDSNADQLFDQATKVGSTAEMLKQGIIETTIIELAQRIAGKTDDLDQAWLTLQDAMDTAVGVQREGRRTSNHGDFVNEVLARVAELARMVNTAMLAMQSMRHWPRKTPPVRGAKSGCWLAGLRWPVWRVMQPAPPSCCCNRPIWRQAAGPILKPCAVCGMGIMKLAAIRAPRLIWKLPLTLPALCKAAPMATANTALRLMIWATRCQFWGSTKVGRRG